jgi:hypothetical protein
MATRAFVVHRIAGRLRLRIPDHKGDGLFFATLAESVCARPGVAAARPSPIAASLVIEHEFEDPAQLDALLRDLGLEPRDGEPPTEPPLQVLLGGVRALEHDLRRVTGDATDLRTLGFLALATAGLVQIARGNALSAASSLLWHATDLLREASRTADSPRTVEVRGPVDEAAMGRAGAVKPRADATA